MQFWAYINTKKSKVEGEAQRYVCFWPHLLWMSLPGHKIYKNKTMERTGKLGSAGTCVWEEGKAAECSLCIRHCAEVFQTQYTSAFWTALHCTITNWWTSPDAENELAVFTQPEQGRTRLGIQLSPAPKSFLLHFSPLTKMLNYTPTWANPKASRLLPYPPSIVHSGLHSAWAALLLHTLHSHCLCPPILRVLLSCLILREEVLNWE